MVKKEEICAFCGKKITDYPELRFIKSDYDANILICEDCINTANAVVNDTDDIAVDFIPGFKESFIPEEETTFVLHTPTEIRNYLSEYIIGQETGKEIISVASYNHYKHLKYLKDNVNNDKSIELERSNILLAGSTGSGKTLMLKTLGKYLNVPVAICDCSNLSKTG